MSCGAVAGRDEDDSGFLDRFDDEPSDSGGVVRRIYPELHEEADGPHGPVEQGEPPWRERRWARWLVVVVIWLVALMLIGSFLLRAL